MQYGGGTGAGGVGRSTYCSSNNLLWMTLRCLASLAYSCLNSSTSVCFAATRRSASSRSAWMAAACSCATRLRKSSSIVSI